ncbi:coiled-coil domain-containing protein 57 [Gadus macrocephalus]|uniref:coiled-coil domain-containing protein 57 n=1 Tax=Gadus macrocephalus TaxID=80720 RepID=UPI0028CB6284|nr:coiled-coil domain-containing protein 57 [Gadus macrocephalus]
MKAVDGGEPEHLEAQLATKEREWKELQTLRARQLESSLKDAQEQLSSLRQRFKQLREDFQYNLSVLEDRDRELERYDAEAAKAQTVESARLEELSQLRIQVAKLSDQKARETQERGQELRRSQLKATEHRVQLEKLQGSMAADLQKQREDYEGMKRHLERRIKEVEGELALQRQEMTADFDNVLRLREHEFNLRMDEMRTVLLSHEIKVKLLSKETEYQAQAQQEASDALQASEGLCGQTRDQLRRTHLEHAETTALGDNRIKELEKRLTRMEAKLGKEKEEHVKKHRALERALRERDGALAAQQEALRVQTEAAETAAGQARAQLQDQQRTLAERDQAIQRLHGELETARCNWDKYIKQASKETVARDTALLTAQETEARLKSELDRRRQETEKFQQQLSAGLQREEALEQRRIQVELDWQRRCEETKTQHYLTSQGLIQGLTQARDQAQAELKERGRELEEASFLLQALQIKKVSNTLASFLTSRHFHGSVVRDGPTSRGDSTVAPLHPRGAVCPWQGAPGPVGSELVSRLQEQNSSLRAVVAQMRMDMEGLGGAPLPRPATTARTQAEPGASSEHTAPPTGGTDATRPEGTPEYTCALEQEVAELKRRCRQLEEQLSGATTTPETPTLRRAPVAPVAPENTYMQNHIRSLNETIGVLRLEKVASGAAQKKQEVRIAHLESAIAGLTQQGYAEQAEGGGLRLELANQKSKWASTESGLRQRLAAVEMELEGERKEKEEYQKGNILHNLDTVALRNQVSALKLDIASRRDPIVCEQSEMVGQLREENLALRRQPASPGGLGPGAGCVCGGGGDGPLQAKLRQAVRYIARLSRDKQQLIAMGNGLRAQLQTSGPEETCNLPFGTPNTEVPGSARAPETPAGERDRGQPDHHLSTLEKLQYQLTTQELQYAQRAQGVPIVTVRTLLSESDSGSQKGAANPWVQGRKETARREMSSSMDRPPDHRDTGPQPRSSSSGPLMSSVATEGSLSEMWQMLDRDLSPSLLTEGEAELDRPAFPVPAGPVGSDSQLRLQGIKVTSKSVAPFPDRSRPGKTTSHQAKTSKTAGATTTNRASRIRNYNVKD